MTTRLDDLLNTLLIATTVILLVVAQIDFGAADTAVAAAPEAAPVQVALAPAASR